MDDDGYEDEPLGSRWAQRDLLWALIITFAAMAVLSLSAVTVEKKLRTADPQGQMLFTLNWTPAANADVDLWVKAPNEAPVGYSHPGDTTVNLVRDDLGRQRDKNSRNEELAIARATPAGEWAVNVMLYASYDLKLPVPAHVQITMIDDMGPRLLVDKTVSLEREGQEITVVRFTLDDQKRIVPGSVNDVPIRLYGGGGP